MSTEIHMVAFEKQDEARAREFVCEMEAYANKRVSGIARKSIVATGEQFRRELLAETRLLLVSAHGPKHPLAEPVIGDGNEANRTWLRNLGRDEPFALGACAGIIWDVCYSGKFAFLREPTRLSPPGVVHIAPEEMIRWGNSKRLVQTILDELLPAGRVPVITPDSVAAAAAKAAPLAGIKLWRGPLTAAKPS